MKLLLTSAGVKNASIRDALLDLLGKAHRPGQRTLHSHRDVRAPLRRSWPGGMGVHRRSGAPVPNDRDRLEVHGSAGADGAAQHR